MTFPEATKDEKRSIRRIRNQLVKGKDEKPANTITNFVRVYSMISLPPSKPMGFIYMGTGTGTGT